MSAAGMIAALYVQRGGVYYGLPDVDPWDEARDARKYAGPWPVVAHPPCERWGKYWFGSPSSGKRFVKGDDGGCFRAALAAVRTYGGALEHPESSAAWFVHGLRAPPQRGGWVAAGDFIGWTCCVEQGNYGHRARKRTWIYACGVDLPSLRWGESASTMPQQQRLSRARGDRTANDAIERMGHRERSATPIPFRDLLLGIARSAARVESAA